MARLQGLLDAVSTTDTTPASQAPAGHTAWPEGWRATHGVQMQHNTKDGRAWYSHKVEGKWCKGK